MRSGIAVRGDPDRPGIFTPSQAIPTPLTLLRGNQDENSASIWMRRPAVLERGRA